MTYDELPQPIYISGPMTGLLDYNRGAFRDVATKLREQGCVVLHPAEIDGDEDWTWEQWMREAIKMLLFARSVVLLPGWRASQGASLEYEIAVHLGMEIEEWRMEPQ